MLDVLQFLFATAKDQNLYFNRENLITELIDEQEFLPDEVDAAMVWFNPIIASNHNFGINPESIRGITTWEFEHLPPSIITQIFRWQIAGDISLDEREILLDRLTELSLDFEVDEQEMQEILDGLLFHLQNYKHNTFKGASIQGVYWCQHNSTIH